MTMNRDERRDRQEAEILKAEDDICHPIDLEAGGTWIGMSKRGWKAALLNNYQGRPNPTGFMTRGGLIPEALSLPTDNAIQSYLNELDYKKYQAFHLVLSKHDRVLIANWTGIDYTVKQYPLGNGFFLTSTSERLEEITAYRNSLYNSFALESMASRSAAKIRSVLHMSQDIDDKSKSIRMERQRVHSKSLTQIIDTQSEIRMDYWPDIRKADTHAHAKSGQFTY